MTNRVGVLPGEVALPLALDGHSVVRHWHDAHVFIKHDWPLHVPALPLHRTIHIMYWTPIR